jgi:hypothetical protein
MKSLAFGKTDQCVVLIHGRHPLSDPEWKAYLEFVRRAVEHEGIHRVLVWTAGAGPSSKQRHQGIEIFKSHGGILRTAVLSSSPSARGILSALSWFVKLQYRVFAPNDMDAALAYLEVPLADTKEIKELTEALKREVV